MVLEAVTAVSKKCQKISKATVILLFVILTGNFLSNTTANVMF